MDKIVQRDTALDAVRGFALLGILIANLSFFAMPGGVAGTWWREAFPGWLDVSAVFVIRAGFENTFILVFSFLFGYGAARQIAGRSAGWFRRRLLGLGLIGVAHALLFWAGDILLAYALIGLVLPVAFQWNLAVLLRAAALLWCIAVLGNAAVGLFLAALDPLPPDAAAAIALHQSDDFAGIFGVRAGHWAEFYGFGLFVLMPLVAAACLLGVLAGRWLDGRQPSDLQPSLAVLARFVLWPAVLGSAAYGALATVPKNWGADALIGPEIILRALFSPLLAAVILAGSLAFFAARPRSRLTEAFCINGRLSLSIYVGQSIACVLLFHGYGAGLYGEIGPAGSLVAAVILFAAMTVLAICWWRLVGRGPLERLVDQLAFRERAPALAGDRPVKQPAEREYERA